MIIIPILPTCGASAFCHGGLVGAYYLVPTEIGCYWI